MTTKACTKCDRPLMLMLQSKGGPFVRLERRTICASCRPQPLAHPCSVKGCCGAANNERGARLCLNCRKQAKLHYMASWRLDHLAHARAANKACYEKNREARLAQRRQRRQEQGAAIRAAERARYALKQSKLKEQSCCTSDS